MKKNRFAYFCFYRSTGRWEQWPRSEWVGLRLTVRRDLRDGAGEIWEGAKFARQRLG